MARILRQAALLASFILATSLAMAAQPGDVKKGSAVFEKATCAGCHPGGGNALKPTRPIKGPEFAARYKDDTALIKLIRSGVPTTAMPAFAKDTVSDSDMNDLVAYIRSLTPASGSPGNSKSK